MINKIKIYIFSILLPLVFSGCLSTIMLTGTIASSVLTVQEVEEDYDNDIVDYIKDKSEILYDYLKEKTSN